MKTRYEHEETVNKGMHMIYTGGKYDSQLIILSLIDIQQLRSILIKSDIVIGLYNKRRPHAWNLKPRCGPFLFMAI